jgi:hypothetical protein
MWNYICRIRNGLKTLILAEIWIKRQPINSIFKNSGLPRATREYLTAEKRYEKLAREFRLLISEYPISKQENTMMEMER